MSTTTAAAIRDTMIAAVRALVPSSIAQTRFTAHDERADFRQWAEANKTAAFRRFSVRDAGSINPPVVSNTDVEWVETQFECVVAFPRDYRYGAGMQLGADDCAELDMRQVEHTIGTNGFATLTSSGSVQTAGVSREAGAACVFGVLRLNVGYWRAMP